MSEPSICVICTDECTEADLKSITLGCSHRFHSSCLFRWLDGAGRNDNTERCPQCREKVIEWPSNQVHKRRKRKCNNFIRVAFQAALLAMFVVILTGVQMLYAIKTRPAPINNELFHQCVDKQLINGMSALQPISHISFHHLKEKSEEYCIKLLTQDTLIKK